MLWVRRGSFRNTAPNDGEQGTGMSNSDLAERLQQTLAELDGQQVTANVLKELVRMDALDCASPDNKAAQPSSREISALKDLDSQVSDG